MASVMKFCPDYPPTSGVTVEPTTCPPTTPGISTPRFWNFPLDGAEAGQSERDAVGARPQLDDLVLTLRVRDHRPDLFDQRGARGSTVTPGRTAPVVSLAVPAMVPAADCAKRGVGPVNSNAVRPSDTVRALTMLKPPIALSTIATRPLGSPLRLGWEGRGRCERLRRAPL